MERRQIMDIKNILEVLAPCGLNCKKCFAYTKGEIKHHAENLNHLLENFHIYAERFVKILNEPRYTKYPQFEEVLKLLTEASCKGCRNNECLLKGCGVIHCYKEKNVDFCFECLEFPCDKSNFDEHLKKRWLKSNLRMKEIGIEKYFEEIKDESRYN
jgi:hypothetical protein